MFSGDSGGAIFSYDSAIQKYVVVGITSFGTNPCAMPGYPGYELILILIDRNFKIFIF
jgi:secreted trypsin-like serine protease